MIDSTEHKKNSSIIMTSRIRLARNVAGMRFANSASPDELTKIYDICFNALSKVRQLKNRVSVKMSEISELGRSMLIEDKLISRELPAGSPASGVCYSTDNHLSAMINEEDHLRIQALGNGMCLKTLWRKLNATDDAIEKNIEYAFSDDFGYLTACPTNVGTGMRASLMMHLPALALTEQMEKIARGLNQLGMVVRGADGEGSDSYGAFFQISNQQTLGMSEDDIIKKIIKFGDKVCEFEINARLKLWQDSPIILQDKISRAIAILKNCKLIDTAEAMEYLSTLRLCADMGLMQDATYAINMLDEVMLDIKPAHIQRKFNIREIDSQERDKVRASYLNSVVKSLPKLKIK